MTMPSWQAMLLIWRFGPPLPAVTSVTVDSQPLPSLKHYENLEEACPAKQKNELHLAMVASLEARKNLLLLAGSARSEGQSITSVTNQFSVTGLQLALLQVIWLLLSAFVPMRWKVIIPSAKLCSNETVSRRGDDPESALIWRSV
jgi:hypothetical protein